MEEGYTESEIIVGLSYKPYILWKLMTPTIHYIKNTQIQKKMQSTWKTEHVLCFLKAGGSKISNMTFPRVKSKLHKYTHTNIYILEKQGLQWYQIWYQNQQQQRQQIRIQWQWIQHQLIRWQRIRIKRQWIQIAFSICPPSYQLWIANYIHIAIMPERWFVVDR